MDDEDQHGSRLLHRLIVLSVLALLFGLLMAWPTSTTFDGHGIAILIGYVSLGVSALLGLMAYLIRRWVKKRSADDLWVPLCHRVRVLAAPSATGRAMDLFSQAI